MDNRLDRVLTAIGESHRELIAPDSRFYMEVDIGGVADGLGFTEIGTAYRNVHAVVPLREPQRGMKVRIDGRTFVRYAQFESGVAAPGYVAAASALPHRRYRVHDSMIKNFT